jgi:hypothetical protein
MRHRILGKRAFGNGRAPSVRSRAWCSLAFVAIVADASGARAPAVLVSTEDHRLHEEAGAMRTEGRIA